jgi:hypothetical protein
MIILYIVAACSFFGIFVLFLVLSKTLNNIMNNCIKLQYLLQKELDFKKEQFAIKTLMEEDKANAKKSDDAENDDEDSSTEQNSTAKK